MSQLPADNAAVSELSRLAPMLDHQGGYWTASFQGLTLKTALQPIYSICHKRIVGYEALVRAYDPDRAPVLPTHLFRLPVSDSETRLLDRLCRLLHMRNFSCLSDSMNWLFLNVSPAAVTDLRRSDSFFPDLLEHTGLPPQRIVMEIVEQPTDDSGQLRETVARYRRLGCLTAIDDFGAGHSNFERIWNLSPDIVKLDRTLLTRATEDHKARQILNGIVSLLHQSGCLVLLEGVETLDQALIAIDAGVDFVQGFFFCQPSTELRPLAQGQGRVDFDRLLDTYKQRSCLVQDPTHQLISRFEKLFRTATERLCAGAGMRQACPELLSHPDVSRCYLVDAQGIQVEETLVSQAGLRNQDPRFRPLQSTTSADWYRQQYLRRALAQPETLQATAPYLCVTGAYMCVTLSLGFYLNGELRVLCCDILSDTRPRFASV